jgi:Preprotein translocase subunit SecB
MLPEQPEQLAADGLTIANEEAASSMQPLYLLPFGVQLQNIFSTEIIARRFPIDILNAPEARLNISEIQIDGEHLRAQVILDVHIEFSGEARPFEISFKMVGLFIYMQEYSTETLHSFLAQGSLSVMLPFARELLLNLCNRLQIPPLMLTLSQLAPPPSMTETKEENAPH